MMVIDLWIASDVTTYHPLPLLTGRVNVRLLIMYVENVTSCQAASAVVGSKRAHLTNAHGTERYRHDNSTIALW